MSAKTFEVTDADDILRALRGVGETGMSAHTGEGARVPRALVDPRSKKWVCKAAGRTGGAGHPKRRSPQIT
jgi:hypothetical protein